MAEITIGGDDDEQSSSGGSFDIDAILARPEVRGILAAAMEDNGVDPTMFGLSNPNDDSSNDAEDIPTDEQPDKPDAEDLDQMLGQLINFMGEDITLPELREMVNEQPEQVNRLLEEAGFR